MSQFVWELVKNNNSFLRKGLHGAQFSAEANNLYNVNSYKFSGLANSKTVAIAAEGDAIKVSTGTKKANQPTKATRSFTTKKNARRALVTIAKEVSGYRSDLKNAAVARVAAVAKSLRVKKYGGKK